MGFSNYFSVSKLWFTCLLGLVWLYSKWLSIQLAMATLLLVYSIYDVTFQLVHVWYTYLAPVYVWQNLPVVIWIFMACQGMHQTSKRYNMPCDQGMYQTSKGNTCPPFCVGAVAHLQWLPVPLICPWPILHRKANSIIPCFIGLYGARIN